MRRTVLLEVPDPGAAEMVVAALTEEGIGAEVRRASRNPYQVTAFAEPLRISVAAADVARARVALERLQLELAEEVDAQAGRPEPAEPPAHRPNPAIAVALGLLVPVPAACLYVGWRRAGLALLAVFSVAAGVVLVRGVDHPASFVLVAAKLADLGTALVAVARRR